jgi:ABC-2 type transport system ATP-binding protein
MNVVSEDRPAVGEATIRLTGVARSFKGPNGPIQAVRGIDLVIAAGETVALLGPNGAGKSTTIDMLLGLLEPEQGAVSVFGRSPAEAVAEGAVGAMLQTGALIRDLSARELLDMIASLYPKPLDVQRVIELTGIAEIANQRTQKLSGGETQRVRFAAALVSNAQLLVLDEPTVAMDVEGRRAFWTTMRDFAAHGRTILFATHYLEEADQAADRILVINRGRLLADGTPAEIKSRAGAKQLSFRLEHVNEPFLLGLPGLVSLDVHGDIVHIQSSDSDKTLYAVLDAGYRPSDIEVAGLGLEQAFLAITAEDDRAAEDEPAAQTTKQTTRSALR